MSSNRIIVDAAICDEFAEHFTDHASKLKYGDPKGSHTVIGPIINRPMEGRKNLLGRQYTEGATRSFS